VSVDIDRCLSLSDSQRDEDAYYLVNHDKTFYYYFNIHDFNLDVVTKMTDVLSQV